MNRFLAITALLLACLGLIAGGIGYLCLRHHPSHADSDTLAWLRQEFELNDKQFAQIEQLHSAYARVCAVHCQTIREQRERVAHLRSANAPQAEIAAADARAEEFDAHCIASVQAHAREVAALIGGEQGERYLAIVLPRIAGFNHNAAPDLTFNSATNAAPTCH